LSSKNAQKNRNYQFFSIHLRKAHKRGRFITPSLFYSLVLSLFILKSTERFK